MKFLKGCFQVWVGQIEVDLNKKGHIVNSQIDLLRLGGKMTLRGELEILSCESRDCAALMIMP